MTMTTGDTLKQDTARSLVDTYLRISSELNELARTLRLSEELANAKPHLRAIGSIMAELHGAIRLVGEEFPELLPGKMDP